MVNAFVAACAAGAVTMASAGSRVTTMARTVTIDVSRTRTIPSPVSFIPHAPPRGTRRRFRPVAGREQS
jgi:hypothetical protein